jgi:hypothetical protein
MRTNAYDCWPAGEGIPQPVGIRIEGKFPLTVKVEVIPFGFLRSPAIEAWNDSSVSEHDVCLADSAHMRAGGFRCGVTFQDRGTGRGDHPSRLRRVGPGRKGDQRDSADRAGDEATPRHARCGNRADFFRVHSSSITKRIARRFGSDHRSRRCQQLIIRTKRWFHRPGSDEGAAVALVDTLDFCGPARRGELALGLGPRLRQDIGCTQGARSSSLSRSFSRRCRFASGATQPQVMGAGKLPRA